MSKYIKEGDVIVALMDAPWRDDNDEDVAYDALDSVRAADVAEVRHGAWIDKETCYMCSLCGRIERLKEPYCHCGAKMDGETK